MPRHDGGTGGAAAAKGGRQTTWCGCCQFCMQSLYAGERRLSIAAAVGAGVR